MSIGFRYIQKTTSHALWPCYHEPSRVRLTEEQLTVRTTDCSIVLDEVHIELDGSLNLLSISELTSICFSFNWSSVITVTFVYGGTAARSSRACFVTNQLSMIPQQHPQQPQLMITRSASCDSASRSTSRGCRFNL